MELSSWQLAGVALVLGTGGGVIFWSLARLALYAGGLWRGKPPFAADLLADAGESERRRHRQAGRELAALLGAFLSNLITATLAWLLLPLASLPSLPSWMLIVSVVLAFGLLAAGAWLAVRLLRARRSLKFSWAAKSAIGNILKRLNFAGNRVFHDVRVEGARIDHVVVGAKGVFAINVVARPVSGGSDTRPAAELRNGKLSLGGNVEALPVGDAARNMTLLTGALTKVVGHRVPVRSVLAVPGWHSVPSGEGNHLLLNEGNLAMLTSWNKPDAYLMDEDCVAIQKFLQEAARVRTMS